MMYFGSFFAGIINGLFASGAGQILVFILVFILKEDSHKARGTSVFSVGVITIFTLTRYINNINIKVIEIIIVAIIGIIFGYIGSKLMKKIYPVYLNLVSGILVLGFSLYSLLRG